MPFCDNSGDLIQLQTKINEISDREISYRKETNSDSLHRWKQLSLRKQQCTFKGACLYLLSKWQYDSGGSLCDPYVSLCDAGLFVSV